jgi:nucleotide-binding universal stress UspA family protein
MKRNRIVGSTELMKASAGDSSRRKSQAQETQFPQVVREILVPVDFSTASSQALSVAGDWAERFGARVHLLYAIEPPTVPQWGYVFLALREGKLRKEAEEQLNKLRRHVSPGVTVTTEVRSGYGAEYEICEMARKRKTDLIVIGSHGAGAIRRAMMGSTAERVVRHAPCPVLVIREQSRPKAKRR